MFLVRAVYFQQSSLRNQTINMQLNFTIIDENDETNLVNRPDFFQGVYQDPYFKILALLTYLITYLCVFMLLFVLYFERSGQAGHYRTLLNQLTSLNNDNMILTCIFPLNFDLLRVFYGPLPESVCFFVVFMKNVLHLNICFIALLITLTKFLIICVYKSIPIMNDNFLTVFLYTSVYLISILTTCARKYLPGRPILNEVNKTYLL